MNSTKQKRHEQFLHSAALLHCYATGLFSRDDVIEVFSVPDTACQNKSTHACRQSPHSYIISSWSFLPASTRKKGVAPLRTAPCHSAPAGQTGKYIKYLGYSLTWRMTIGCGGDTWAVQNVNPKGNHCAGL